MSNDDERLAALPTRLRREADAILSRHDSTTRTWRETIIRPDGPAITGVQQADGSRNFAATVHELLRQIDNWHAVTMTTVDQLVDICGDDHQAVAVSIAGDLLGDLVRGRTLVWAGYFATAFGRDLAQFRIGEDASIFAAGRRIPLPASALASAPIAPPTVRFAVEGNTDPSAVAARLRELAEQVEAGQLAI
ncbi:conserved hypothetical protein [Frankia canadensis]|uniref:Uncharacterized protein n=1 Tax=Frankia canadensis TaxID=1836972 RepID=A0A2I2KN16_9ACTN|nr:hypothetical protein [Frankia canadensis]SNQ47058.1 conserved hypothetical protein [Frankia canadensis]SOU54348.1 conserved hypothetical protein [Frankia canadensis]